MKYLVLDTETGGLDENVHSLLTVGMVIIDDDKIIDRTEFRIKKDCFNVSSEALKINNIDLTTLEEPEYEAFQRMLNFINRHFKSKKINLLGHNIQFDIRFFKKFWEDNINKSNDYLLKENFNYNKIFSHHNMDTMVISKFLKDIGRLKVSSVSLENLIYNFNLKAESRHTAMEDATMTALVYFELKKMFH